ncbi:ABC transporter permease [Dongia deserti]|uniref:ABC transporter permease n=1 Tax=Dongia deserti TaxID=2268030 RepID=UPI0013C45154|nr:ABC transporter permease [Dongia deserti]
MLTFLWPLGRFLYLAVDNSDIVDNLPRTVAALATWQRADGVPGEDVFGALAQDLADARSRKTDGIVAQLINQRLVGTRYLILKTAKLAEEGAFETAPRAAMLQHFPEWNRVEVWSTIADDSARLTDFYLLSSLDLRRTAEGSVAPAPAGQAVFVQVLLRTIWISVVVTLVCAVVALPVAHAIVAVGPTASRVLIALILFPLWTSLLIRTVIWIILLQANGPVNGGLQFLGIIVEPLDLIYTRTSLYIAMVQVLLPMMILSIVAVMRRTPKDYMKAALSLGAPWFTAWRRVQLPLIMPGILAGCGIVFVFSLGYYITPALIGGPKEQMISSFIAFYTNNTLNWGLAAALSIQLLLLLVLTWCALMLGRGLVARRSAA